MAFPTHFPHLATLPVYRINRSFVDVFNKITPVQDSLLAHLDIADNPKDIPQNVVFKCLNETFGMFTEPRRTLFLELIRECTTSTKSDRKIGLIVRA